MRRYKLEDLLKSAGVSEEQQNAPAPQGEGFKVPETIRSGDRHEMLYKLLRSQKARGISMEAALVTCYAENKAKCNPPVEHGELKRYLERVWEQPDSPSFVQNAPKHQQKDVEDGQPLISGEKQFVRAKQGDKILPNDRQNVLMAFKEMGVSLRFDVFAQKPFIKYGSYDGVLMDEVRNRIWLEIDHQFGFRPSPDFFDVVLSDEAARNKVHPVCEYLDSLKWDGVPRIENWLVNATGAGDSLYIKAISKLVLVAAVRRVRKPGCKFDEMLVLESDVQGLQKSTALRALAGNDAWFSDDLPLDVDAKQVIERTGGKWIIEAQELSGLHKSRAEQLKSMLSRQVDGPVRMAYARLPVEQPRQFIIIGTTNGREYLSDSTGNRRFWPVQIDFCNVDFIIKWRDQWWAEAAAYEKQGMSIRLDPKLYSHAEVEQEDRRTADPWEMRIRAAFDQETHRITPQEIWTLLNVPVERQDHRLSVRISQIMQRCGFRRMSVRDETLSGKVVKGWGKGESLRSSVEGFDE